MPCTDSYFVYVLKMEYIRYIPKINVFCTKNDGEKWYRKNIFEIPPCTHHVIFITESVLLIKIPPFYEVNSFNRKW